MSERIKINLFLNLFVWVLLFFAYMFPIESLCSGEDCPSKYKHILMIGTIGFSFATIFVKRENKELKREFFNIYVLFLGIIFNGLLIITTFIQNKPITIPIFFLFSFVAIKSVMFIAIFKLNENS